LQRALSKINYRIHTDAIKEQLIPAMATKEQAATVYASADEKVQRCAALLSWKHNVLITSKVKSLSVGLEMKSAFKGVEFAPLLFEAESNTFDFLAIFAQSF
jgi:hypothetical protein